MARIGKIKTTFPNPTKFFLFDPPTMGKAPDPLPAPAKIPEAKRTTWYQQSLTAYGVSGGQTQQAPENSNLISSLTDKGTHMPALDIDFPCRLEPSSTPGHFHLYLEKEMDEVDYLDLLNDLEKYEILEPAFVDCAIKEKKTFLRFNHDKHGDDLKQYDSEILIEKSIATVSECKQLIHSFLNQTFTKDSIKPNLEKMKKVLSSVEEMLKEAI